MRKPRGKMVVVGVAALATGVLVLLVMAGLLGRRNVTGEDQAALETRSTANLETMQKGLSRSITGLAGSDVQARLDSPHGQALFRLCAEWTDLYERNPGKEPARQRDEACRRFKTYVDEGIDPAKSADD